jgi:hypothetical protein
MNGRIPIAKDQVQETVSSAAASSSRSEQRLSGTTSAEMDGSLRCSPGFQRFAAGFETDRVRRAAESNQPAVTVARFSGCR